MDWHTFLIITHIIGTVLGVGGATFAEVFYLKAIKDGEIDPTESSFLKTTYFILRIGIILLVLSGFGLLLLNRLEGATQYLYSPRLWAKLTLTVIIVANAVLLQVRLIPAWLGFSLSFTSWYVALILGLWRGASAAGYATIMLWYVGAVFVVAFILDCIKKWYVTAPLPKKI